MRRLRSLEDGEPTTLFETESADLLCRDAPLALYVFSDDKTYQKKIFDNTQSGAAVANDVLTLTAVDYLPFGGIGESGR